MAALMELVSLTGLHDPADILGIQEAEDEDNILVTYKSGHIYLYQVSEKKVLYMWTVKHGLQLISSAVQIDEDHFAVIVSKPESQSIRTWSKKDTVIGKDTENKTKLDRNAVCLLSIARRIPVILFTDGSITSLDTVQSHDTDGPIRNQEHIIWYSLKTLPSETDACLPILFKTQDDQYNMLVYWLSWVDGELKVTHSDPWMTQINHLISCDVSFSQQGELELYVLVTDHVNNAGAISLKHLKLIKDAVTMKLETITNLDAVLEDSRLAMMDDLHLAITGVTSHDLDMNQDDIAIIDVKYAAAQQVKKLPEGCDQCRKLYKASNHLIVTCGKNTWAFPYKSGPSKLGILLGRFSKTDTDDMMITASWGETKKTNMQNKNMKKAKTLLEKLISNTQDCTEVVICSDLSSLADSLEDSPPLDLQPLIDTCLNKLRFWPRKEIRQLITSGFIPSSCCEMLVTKLIAKEDIELLILCLDHISEVPEKSLIMCLGFFLRCGNDKFVNRLTGTSKVIEEQIEFSRAKATAVNTVLLQPFNDVFLLDNLRSLNFTDVKVFLGYLTSLLIGSESDTDTDTDTDTNQTELDNQPSLKQVIDWLSVCMDAHYTQLVLSPDTRELLLNLHQSVSAKKEFYEGLGDLEPILTKLKQKCDLPRKKIGQYCIETLHM